MQQNESLLLALVVVLVLVVLWQNRSLLGVKDKFYEGQVIKGAGIYDAIPSTVSPYTPIGYQNSVFRNLKLDGNDPSQMAAVGNLSSNYAYWATTPRDLEEQQRNAWFESISGGSQSGNVSYDPTGQYDAAGATSQYHTPCSSLNYQDALVDLVADGRMRAAHDNWHSEVGPFSQTSMKVDNFDEAATMTQAGQGLYAFRFSAPAVHNPWQVTEQDPVAFAQQSTSFSFGA